MIFSYFLKAIFCQWKCALMAFPRTHPSAPQGAEPKVSGKMEQVTMLTSFLGDVL